jgi:hypothetical protein
MYSNSLTALDMVAHTLIADVQRCDKASCKTCTFVSDIKAEPLRVHRRDARPVQGLLHLGGTEQAMGAWGSQWHFKCTCEDCFRDCMCHHSIMMLLLCKDNAKPDEEAVPRGACQFAGASEVDLQPVQRQHWEIARQWTRPATRRS